MAEMTSKRVVLSGTGIDSKEKHKIGRTPNQPE